MKKIFTLFITILIIWANHFSAVAQCSAYISGDPCITTVLTANFSGNAPSLLEWYRNGVLEQIRTKRNPNSIIVAGGGTSDESQLYGPHDVAVDNNGNIFIVDNGRQRVQKWAPGATQGVTVAGANGKGSNLNQLFTPQGIAADDDGNVYISDDVLCRVTKWAPGAAAGVIVAGGNGAGNAANQLNGPQNIFLDDTGNLYIADRWNHRVQKWAPGATAGVTVAGGNGNGSAANQLSEPLDVVADHTGNIFVIDYYNNRVQKWAPGAATGITVAGGNGRGTAANQFNFTTALSITGNGTLYIRDQGNYRVQKWPHGATTGITVAGGNGTGNSTQNKVSSGFGLFVDEAENIYVPELFENTVKKFVPASGAEIQYTASVSGSYYAIVRNGNGCNAKSPVFNVLAVPEKPVRLIGPTAVSEGQRGIVYKVEAVKGTAYQWTVPADATIVRGQGKQAILVKWGSLSGAVTVIAKNACGVAAVKQKYVYVAARAFAMGNSFAEYAKLKVYPNPVVNEVSVAFKSSKTCAHIVTITDVAGKTLVTKKAIFNEGDNKIDIAVDKFKAGTYFIHLTDDEHGSRKISFVKR